MKSRMMFVKPYHGSANVNAKMFAAASHMYSSHKSIGRLQPTVWPDEPPPWLRAPAEVDYQ